MRPIYFVLAGIVVTGLALAWCFQDGPCGGGGDDSTIPTPNPIADAINAGTGATVAQSISSAGTALWNLITTGSAGDQ